MITFVTSDLSGIKSISQRGLAMYWQRLCGERSLPRFDEFRPGSRKHDRQQIAIWKVERDGGQRTFRSLHIGAFYREGLGIPDSSGLTLEQLTPPMLHSAIVGGSNECVDTKCAVYMVLSTIGVDGHGLDLERLLLPFGRDREVEQIVASMQLVSLKGTVVRRNVVKQFEAECSVTLAVKIMPRALRVEDQSTTETPELSWQK